MDAKTCLLEVRAQNRVYRLTAQFLDEVNGRLVYSTKLSPESTIGFIGWLPYFNRRWPEAIDKKAFKASCSRLGVNVPATGARALEHPDGVIVKAARGSFGRQVRGPFKLSDRKPALKSDEFYEQFTPGKIAKAWFWNDVIIALEITDMPGVTGDGATPIRSQVLSVASPARSARINWSAVQQCLAWQDLTLDDMLPLGRQALIDFRYGSFVSSETSLSNQLPTLKDSNIAAQLRSAGYQFYSMIPESIQHGTLYSIDAIIDAHEVLWFLEMNCNPIVHPAVYPAMFRTLFEGSNEPSRVGDTVASSQSEAPAPSSSPPMNSRTPEQPAKRLPTFRIWN